MKNKILKVLGIITLSFTFSITYVEGLSETQITDKHFDAVFTDELLKNNLYQAEIAQKIDNIIKSYYVGTYPSYYGGMHISNNSLNLIIRIVEKNIPQKNTEEHAVYREIIGLNKSIKVEYVKYSYNELNEIYNALVDYTYSPGKINNLASFYIDGINNKIAIELLNNSSVEQDKATGIFKKALVSAKTNSRLIENYSELINFSENNYEFTANLKPGGYINNGSGGCSMGFRVKYNGKAGYMTAGHCFRSKNLGYEINTGTLKVKNFTNGGNYDYAFVETNSSWTPTNTLATYKAGYTTLAAVTYCPYISEGQAIGKSGDYTGYGGGYIYSFNATLCDTYTGECIHNLVKSTLGTAPGDSGGPVYTMRSDSQGGPIAIGIISGGSGAGMYFTNINNLPVSLQTRY